VVRITHIDHRATWLMIVNETLPVRLPKEKIDEVEPGFPEIRTPVKGTGGVWRRQKISVQT
jgi:hypothetical protein